MREELDDISGVSVPIYADTGQVVAVVNLYGPSFRFPPEGQTDDITRLVIETGQKITARIRDYSK